MAHTWSSTEKYSSIVLTTSDTVALGKETITRAVRGTDAVSSGKHYCEIYITRVYVNSWVGICNSSYDAPANDAPGIDVNSWVFSPDSGFKKHNNSQAFLGRANSDLLDTIMIAVDLAADKVWFGSNGIWVGDPAAGTGEAFDSVTATDVYIMAHIGQTPGIPTDDQIELRPASGDWVYSAPSGFSEWVAGAGPTVVAPGAGSLVITGPAPCSFTGLTGNGGADINLRIEGTGVLDKITIGGADLALDIVGVGDFFGDFGGADFSLRIEGFGGGINLSNGAVSLPLIRSTGTALGGTVAVGALELAPVEAVGYAPGESALELPFTTINAQGDIGSLGTSALRVPFVQLTASGDVTSRGTAELVLPRLAVTGGGIIGSIGTTAITLPLVRMFASGDLTNFANTDLDLPFVQLAFSSYLGNVAGAVALVLPPLRAAGHFVPAAFSDEWVTLNTENVLHTRYGLTGVFAVAELEGELYLATTSGLFRLSTAFADDAGTDIDASLRSGITDFNSDFLKAAANLYVGYQTDGVLNTVIGVDGAGSYTYPVDRDLISSGQRGARAKLGRGLRSRYWQVGFDNVAGAGFTLDSYALTLRNLKRKS